MSPIVVCRSAVPPEPIAPHARLGYHCKGCGKPLQVSPTGVAQIARGGTPICNACGAEVMKALKDGEGMIALNPAAMAYLHRRGEDPDSWFPPQPAGPLARVECPLCGKEHQARQGDEIDCDCGMTFRLAKAGV